MIINNLLYTDLYKLTMQYFSVCHSSYDFNVVYKFKCRNPNINLLPYKNEIIKEINNIGLLSFSLEDLNYLSSLQLFKHSNWYLFDYLKSFKLNPNDVIIFEKDNNLDITIKGTWQHTILWEIYILLIVHDIYSRVNSNNISLDYSNGKKILNDKIIKIKKYQDKKGKDIKIYEFGTRRAFTKEWHEIVVDTLVKENVIAGTSNVYLAKKYNIKCVGTFAHELV